MRREVNPVQVGSIDKLSEGGVGPLLPVGLQASVELGTGIRCGGAVHVTAGRCSCGGAVGYLVGGGLSNVDTRQREPKVCSSHLRSTCTSS